MKFAKRGVFLLKETYDNIKYENRADIENMVSR